MTVPNAAIPLKMYVLTLNGEATGTDKQPFPHEKRTKSRVYAWPHRPHLISLVLREQISR